VLRGRWFNIIVRIARAPTSDHSKGNFYEQLQQVLDHFPKYRLKILLEDFNSELDRR
jgi:hypothetical protein